MDEVWRWSARRMAAAIASREVSSREVVTAHLDRITAIEDGPTPLGAVVSVLGDEALAAADDADRAVAEGRELGPLHGVPCSVKENVDVAGHPTTQGAAALADAVVECDAPVVERLRRAGAVPIARTNLPDLGLRVTTESSLHGPTRNPWDRRRSTGGSSGGEAAALATGMSPLGIGNDLGGSLRNPAHCCGIASIKPGRGIVPAASSRPPLDPSLAFQLMAVQGVMARRVADVRAGLLAVAGRHDRDPDSVPASFLPTDPTGGYRVGVLADPPGGPTHPGVVDAVRAAADVLADAGHAVVEAAPPSFEETQLVWRDVLAADLREVAPAWGAVLGEDGRTVLDATLRGMPEHDAGSIHELHLTRRRIAREWARWHADHDVLLTPVWSHPAPPLGFDLPGARPDGWPRTAELFRAVLPSNLLGTPAVAVPVGLVDDLPVAAQVIGPRFAELVCLDVAATVEDALGLDTPIDPVG